MRHALGETQTCAVLALRSQRLTDCSNRDHCEAAPRHFGLIGVDEVVVQELSFANTILLTDGRRDVRFSMSPTNGVVVHANRDHAVTVVSSSDTRTTRSSWLRRNLVGAASVGVLALVVVATLATLAQTNEHAVDSQGASASHVR